VPGIVNNKQSFLALQIKKLLDPVHDTSVWLGAGNFILLYLEMIPIIENISEFVDLSVNTKIIFFLRKK
jgi:hypothetical protein